MAVSTQPDGTAVEPVLQAAKDAISESARGLDHLAQAIDTSFIHAASLLRYCRGKVVLTGAGTNALVAQRAAHLLSVCGTPAFFLDPGDALHGTLGALTPDDVLIAMSKGGGTAEVNSVARLARRRRVRVVALSSNPTSALIEHADVPVIIPTNDDADPGGFIAMGSTLAYSAWLDAMTLVLMRSRRYPWSEVLFTHPSGAVGAVVDEPEPLPPLDLPHPALAPRRSREENPA